MPPADLHLLLRAFADELARCGVEHVVTSPGSRSTPLVLALVRHGGLRAWSHVDERCAGFFALGVAKATGRPAAVCCTSGTAVANLLPAVVEAHEAGVPLLVLTADRPPELREVGAGQTIDQLGIFGRAARWFFEVGTHEATPERTRWMRGLACRAVWTALDRRPGPVHLNFALREPLVPPAELGEDPQAGRPGGAPWLARPRPVLDPARDAAALAGALGGARRGLVVAGRLEGPDPTAGRAAAAFAARAGWPLVADALSGAAGVPHADLLVRDAAFRAAHRPDAVVRVGDLPTSKALRTWLGELPDVPQVAFDPSGVWHDPAGVLRLVLPGDGAGTLDATPTPGEAPAPGWREAWETAGARAGEAVAAALGEGALSEPLVARELAARLPAEATLVVASSMPVRDVETFAAPRRDGPRVLSNRGANGIDGTVSTAFGVAAATGGPVVLLVGDVALLHDLGGLLAAPRLGLPLTVVVPNNDGGGIFAFLPVSGEGAAYQEHVVTAHGRDLAHAAALFGLRHERPADLAAFRDALDRAVAHAGTTLVEVRSDRGANLALHRELAAAAAPVAGP